MGSIRGASVTEGWDVPTLFWLVSSVFPCIGLMKSVEMGDMKITGVKQTCKVEETYRMS